MNLISKVELNGKTFIISHYYSILQIYLFQSDEKQMI